MVDGVPVLAVSAVDVLLFVGLGAAGFIVVALVCAGVLAMLQLILPSTDAGAVAADRLDPPEQTTGAGVDQPPADAEVDA
jgi:hypothetical protein